MTVELIKMFNEHDKTHDAHTEFYELGEKFGFCTPWCHLENDCKLCENKEVSPVV